MQLLPTGVRDRAEPQRPRFLARVRMRVLVAAWVVAVGLGAKLVLDYSLTPGALGAGVSAPAEVGVASSPDRFTLVVALHPECPCSRATAEQIDRLAAARPGRIAMHALFLDTETAGAKPEESHLWKRVAAIPGATVNKGRGEAWCGGAAFLTSGEICLFAPDGALRYHGGITESRGHVGNGSSYDAVLAVIDGRTAESAAVAGAPVFGCSLVDPVKAEAVP